MRKTPPKSTDEFFGRLGQSLARSRRARLVVAPAIAALFFYLAYIAWTAPQLSALIVAGASVCYGIRFASEIYPISAKTREKWAHQKKAAERCSSCRFCSYLWTGVGLAVGNIWRNWGDGKISFYDFIVPGGFILFGGVHWLICRRFIRRMDAADAL